MVHDAFQFHLVRLKVLFPVIFSVPPTTLSIPFSTIKRYAQSVIRMEKQHFQFHLVRLKAWDMWNANNAYNFQFHLVRLKAKSQS